MRRAAALAAALVLGLPAVALASYGDTLRATPGLAAYWPLDEPAGSTAIADVVGNRSAALTATYGAAPGIETGGTSVDLAGGAATFGDTLDFGGDMTIEAWVNERSTTGDRYIVSKGSSAAGYHLYLASGGWATFQVNGTRVAGPALARGTWHQVVATLAGRVMTLYVDGSEAGSDTLPSDPLTSTQNFWIGRLARAATGFWSGSLDEIALYDQALDADTVAAHFDAGLDPTPPESRFVTTPPALSTKSTASFAYVGSKPGLAFSCRLDGGAWTLCLNPVTYSGLGDGEHTVEVRATDRSGAVEATPAAFHWTIDRTPPLSFLLIAQPTALRPATAVIGSEPGATFECRSANGAWAPCPAAFPLPDIGQSYGVFVRAIDRAGNIERGESSATVKARPRGISFTGAPAEFTAASLDLGHPSPWSCSLDGGAAQPCPSVPVSSAFDFGGRLTFSGLGYGTHTLRVADPAVTGIAWPTITWTDPLPAPVLAGVQVPALVQRGARRVPRLLFQSNAPAGARLELLRHGRPVTAWTAPVALGSNVIALSRAAWRRLGLGRYVLTVQAANAVGTGTAQWVRFDVVRPMRR